MWVVVDFLGMDSLQVFRDYAVPVTAVGGFALGVVNFIDRFVSRRPKVALNFGVDHVDKTAIEPLVVCWISVTNVGRCAFSVRNAGILSLGSGKFLESFRSLYDFPRCLRPGEVLDITLVVSLAEVSAAPVIPAVEIFDKRSVRRIKPSFGSAEKLLRLCGEDGGFARRRRRAFGLIVRLRFWFATRKHVGRAKPADKRNG